MAGAATFPTIQAELVSYFNDVVPYLITEKVRLSITNTSTGIMNGQLTKVNLIWTQHEDQLQTGNEIINEKTVKRIDEMIDLLQDVYADIPQSALTDDDKKKTRIFDDKPKGEREAIKTAPLVNMLSRSGATIELTCKVEKDSNRASLHNDADAVEIKYKIGGDEPVNPKECPNTETFKRAKFNLKLDLADVKKDVFAFIRWKNTSDGSKSGPWSRLEKAVITY